MMIMVKDATQHSAFGGFHKLRLQDLPFFDHLPPSVYIFYGTYKSLQKDDFFDHLQGQPLGIDTN